MAICGDLMLLDGVFFLHPHHLSLNPILSSFKVLLAFYTNSGFVSPSTFNLGQKVGSGHFLNGARDLKIAHKWPQLESSAAGAANWGKVCFAVRGNNLPPTVNQDAEEFLLNVVNMSFFDRLGLAWKTLFPTAKVRRNSNARTAKRRLKMILFSDRCAISDEAKQKIVSNIIGALSGIVKIDSEDGIQLNVSADADLGTICSVTVPVRRVLPEYQESEEGSQGSNLKHQV